jgi:tRNA(His) 5'-end guanylyltransferase
MKELPDLVLAYGNSDEYRYVALLTWTFKRARDRLLGR